jgi:hypothetical protein
MPYLIGYNNRRAFEEQLLPVAWTSSASTIRIQQVLYLESMHWYAGRVRESVQLLQKCSLRQGQMSLYAPEMNEL